MKETLWGKKKLKFLKGRQYVSIFASGCFHSSPIFQDPLLIFCPLSAQFSLLSMPVLPPGFSVIHFSASVPSFCSTVIASSQFPKLDPGAPFFSTSPGRVEAGVQAGGGQERGAWPGPANPLQLQASWVQASPRGCRKGPWRDMHCCRK